MEAVGRISKIFGNGGELTVTLFDTFPTDFDTKEPLFVDIDSLAVPLFCDLFRRRGRAGVTVVFADIDTERRASELVGKIFYMELGEAENDPGSNPAASSAFRSSSDAAHAADPDLIYLEDIVGYSATVDGRTGARVEEFIDGDNPLFRLSLDGREVYVPAVDEFITELDSDTCTITFDLPAGLLDIYLE